MTPKFYHVTPATASADADLIATLAANLTLKSMTIVTPTAADVEIKFYDGSAALAQTIAFTLSAGEAYMDDTHRVVPSGGKITVNSSQTDTQFSASGYLL